MQHLHIYQDSFDNREADLDFSRSAEMMKRFADGDLLQGLKNFLAQYEKAERELDQFDMSTYDHEWCWEVSAFNIVCREMSKLFAPKES